MKGKKTLELVDSINESYRYESDSGIESQKDLKDCIKATRAFTWSFYCLLTSGVMAMAMVPLLMLFLKLTDKK